MSIKSQELLVIIGALMIAETLGVDYCSMTSCRSGSHTMCMYPQDAVACPGDGVKAGLTDELRKALLDRHNHYRMTVAVGKESPQPHASNMMKLTWHAEAERIAQRWANQCVFSHDGCRNVEDASVGQNLATISVPVAATSDDVKTAVEKMVGLWYDEVKLFHQGQVDSFQFASQTGHYTQVVWAETTAIGCGLLVKAPENSYFRMVNLVCNYVPGGNFIGSPLYKRGKACSECPKDTKCSMSYPGLCTKDDSDFGGIPKEGDGDTAMSLTPSILVLLCLVIGVLMSCNVLSA